MPIPDNDFNLTEDVAVDIGEQGFQAHVDFVSLAYKNKRIMRAYLCGCLAVIVHWLIKECGGRSAFEILTEMADLAVIAEAKKDQ